MKKKRLLSALLVLTMMFTMGVAGCGKSTDPAKEENAPTEVKVEEKVLRVVM